MCTSGSLAAEPNRSCSIQGDRLSQIQSAQTGRFGGDMNHLGGVYLGSGRPPARRLPTRRVRPELAESEDVMRKTYARTVSLVVGVAWLATACAGQAKSNRGVMITGTGGDLRPGDL